ncbi:hypothetical protein GCM10009606_21760 [Nocardioides aquiterrae]|uniref:Uncharacterized protein n=1 Tax=Nocardioides aquiterrae TaxID=203799 RepID=A0ABN1UE04_9ACTN
MSIALVGCAALEDRDLARTRHDLGSINLGWPLPWIEQDQRSQDPPLPHRMGLVSPWENPTGMSLPALAGNVLLVFAALALVGLMLAAVLHALARRVRGLGQREV